MKKPADSHNLPQEACGKLAPWPSHGSRDSSRTQACIYKAEGEDLSPPLLLQLIPAPAYSPTNTLRSTIGDEVLNCQVRHGAGCVHLSMSTGNFFQPLRLCYISSIRSCGIKPLQTVRKGFMRLRLRRISIGRLKGRYPLTPPTYLSGRLPDALSTFVMRYLISRPASRLDAFSGYPIRTWLPSLCPWQDNWFTCGSSIPVLSY